MTADPYVPLTGPPTWRHAACRGEDPDMWYPFGKNSKLLLNPDGETAFDICRRCQHATQCVDWAIHLNDQFGIWGGLTPEQRDPIQSRRQRHAQQERERRQRQHDTETQAQRRRQLEDVTTGRRL